MKKSKPKIKSPQLSREPKAFEMIIPPEETSTNQGIPSIREYLEAQYGGDYSGKDELECPQCKRLKMSIKGDTLAQCWRPTCKFILSSWWIKAPASPIIQQLLWAFVLKCHEFKQDLLANKTGLGQAAIDYLLQERKIHSDVVKDTITLGLVPYAFDWHDFISSFREQLIEKKVSPEILQDFEAQVANLQKNACQGWVAFAYTDLNHKITSIRFREPGATKKIYWYVPGVGLPKGAFDTLLTDPSLPPPSGVVALCEGEFNVLQFQSLLKRNNDNYAAAYALGGVKTIDESLVQRLEGKLALFEDNDESGRELTQKLAQLQKFQLIRFDFPGDDLDSFIMRFPDPKAAFDTLEEMLKIAPIIYRDKGAICHEIERLRENKSPKIAKELVPDQIGKLLVREFKERGEFLKAPLGPYYLDYESRKVYRLHGSASDTVRLVHSYGLNPAYRLNEAVLNELAKEAYENGKAVEIYQTWHYKLEQNTLYWCNGESSIIKVNEISIKEECNGVDGVLFEPPVDYKPFQIVEIEPEKGYLHELILRRANFAINGLSRETSEKLLLNWILSMPFDTLNPTRPIVTLVGEKGSGKTSFGECVGKLLFGSEFEVSTLPNSEADFDVLVTNQPFVVLDNVDDKKSWLNDRLAMTATGGKVNRRVLYTTNDLIRYPIRSVLAITTRTPEFRRDDVADRLLIFNFQRIQENIPQSELEREIVENRDAFMTWYLNKLQQALSYLGVTEPVKSQFRMADFASFCLRLAMAEGEESYALMQGIFGEMQRLQSKFTTEQDPLCSLILKFSELYNQEFYTANQILNTLKTLSVEYKISLSKDNTPQTLGIQLSKGFPELAEFIRIERQEGRSNSRMYRIVPTSIEELHQTRFPDLEPF